MGQYLCAFKQFTEQTLLCIDSYMHSSWQMCGCVGCPVNIYVRMHCNYFQKSRPVYSVLTAPYTNSRVRPMADVGSYLRRNFDHRAGSGCSSRTPCSLGRHVGRCALPWWCLPGYSVVYLVWRSKVSKAVVPMSPQESLAQWKTGTVTAKEVKDGEGDSALLRQLSLNVWTSTVGW